MFSWALLVDGASVPVASRPTLAASLVLEDPSSLLSLGPADNSSMSCQVKNFSQSVGNGSHIDGPPCRPDVQNWNLLLGLVLSFEGFFLEVCYCSVDSFYESTVQKLFTKGCVNDSKARQKQE